MTFQKKDKRTLNDKDSEEEDDEVEDSDNEDDKDKDDDNEDEIQEQATDLVIPSKLLEINNDDFLEGNFLLLNYCLSLIYSHLSHSLDDVMSDKRKPLTPITNNMNINKLRNNILNNSNEASHSRLHLNTTPRPNFSNNTPQSTLRSNNIRTRSNYDDVRIHQTCFVRIRLFLLMIMIFIRLFELQIIRNPHFQHHFMIW